LRDLLSELAKTSSLSKQVPYWWCKTTCRFRHAFAIFGHASNAKISLTLHLDKNTAIDVDNMIKTFLKGRFASFKRSKIGKKARMIKKDDISILQI